MSHIKEYKLCYTANMNNVEITKDEQHIKSKHRKLMLLFVIANLIFGNSAFAGNVITILDFMGNIFVAEIILFQIYIQES